VDDSLPPGIVALPVLNRSELVNSTISTVARNLTEGALLVVVVLFLLLGNIRAATITALMIPLSFLFAVIGMNRFGISGNLMSLGALDFGLMVDGAVVVIENTLLMLTQRRAAVGRMLTRHERLDVAVQSACQMVKPAAFGQLIILLVFAPLLMLEGVEGKTFQPMGATVMLALVGAFIFSFTFVPAMTALLVRDPKTVHVDADGQAVEHETWILRFARRFIQPAIKAAVGDALFVNARCDVWLRGIGEAESRGDEALRRAAVYAVAGADGFFAPGLVETAGIAALTAGTSLPVNLLAYPGLSGAAELERLGVRRLSAGSGLASAAFGRVAALTRAFLADGNPEPMMEGGLPWSEMNALMP